MGAYDTWNVEINILVCENKMFSLTAEFHFNNWLEIGVHYVWLCQIPLESPWKGDSKKILTFWPAPATSWLTRKSVLSPCLKMITRLKMSQDGCSSSMATLSLIFLKNVLSPIMGLDYRWERWLARPTHCSSLINRPMCNSG